MKVGERLFGVECPECGSTFTGVHESGFDAEGTRLRIRKCKTCQEQFTTLELPIKYNFYSADTRYEPKRKQVARKSSDYFIVSYRDGKREFSVHARLIKGKPSEFCRSGKHRLTGSNLYLRSDGGRKCRGCASDNMKEYRFKNRDILKEKRNARRKRQKEERLNGSIPRTISA